eukprot:COSAG06_NODE_2770_length_6314_cov_1.878681_6_plen_153_part_00
MLFFEFSLRLSRACLGKMIVFSIKWRKRCVFRTSDWLVLGVDAGWAGAGAGAGAEAAIADGAAGGAACWALLLIAFFCGPGGAPAPGGGPMAETGALDGGAMRRPFAAELLIFLAPPPPPPRAIAISGMELSTANAADPCQNRNQNQPLLCL